MTAAAVLFAVVCVGGAAVAMRLRNLVHAALCLVLSFGAVAGLFLSMDAEFAGLAQLLVYVGAVSVLIVFTLFLTRGTEPVADSLFARGEWMGIGLAALCCGTLVMAVLGTPLVESTGARAAGPVAIGEALMTAYLAPLEAVAVLLTAAMIGAVVLALPRGSARTSGPEEAAGGEGAGGSGGASGGGAG